MPTVAISVVNYRTADLTVACVESVLADMAGGAHGPAVDGEVVVVDNASGDGSDARIADWLAARPDAPVRLIRSPVNGGFAAGHNLSIAATASDHVLLLNSDAALRPGCLSTLLAAAVADPGAGLFGPRVADSAGTVQTTCFRFPGVGSELIRGANSGPVTRLLRRWDVPLGPRPDQSRIEWAEFSCILLRRAMIDAIGPLDAGYFLYFEDTEYCLRARRAGWRVVHVPAAGAIHDAGASGAFKAAHAARRRLPDFHYASRARYFGQRGGRAGLWAANLAWLAGRGIAQSRRLFGRRPHPAADREGRDIWTNAADPLATGRAPHR